MAKCNVCFRHCEIKEGGIGFCGGRGCADGKVRSINYGQITSLALDPIEKKPLNRFYPGSKIISVGSYGCNLRCPFCQNDDISWSEQALSYAVKDELDILMPEELVEIAEKYRDRGNIGIAFTYNEPLIGYEYVRDTARLSHEKGMKNVLVSNGTASLEILEEILPYIDAMNIDLKGFTPKYYSLVGGNLEMTKEFIRSAVCSCHVEITTLIIPGENDSGEEIRSISEWIADLKPGGNEIPYHISRFFPRFKMTDRGPTDVKLIYRLADIAREKLKYVYTGNC